MDGFQRLPLDTLKLLFSNIDISLTATQRARIKTYKSTKVDQLGTPIYGFASTALISATVPKELLGTPSADEKIESSDIANEIKFTTVCEDWCEYRLTDGAILRAKTVVTKVFKTKKFNKFGEPIYWASWQMLMDKTTS